ncbi:MAG TPA: pyridoxal-phosphate dependent enzyme, partial [Actinomycetota bacterium]|nr:pyridoxal-phosphate dependent enzyme [Actinomycetota bacterium]
HHATEASRRTFGAMCGLGANVVHAASDSAVPAVLAATYARLAASGRRPYLIAPGGSQPAGVLGAVDAGLELCEQVRAGELEEPDVVVCAFGSGGTAAGLAAGLQLGGLRTQVAAVRVYPFPGAAIGVLARRVLARLGHRGGLDPGRVRVLTGYMGAGYAQPTQAATSAVEAAAGLGLTLESTYTGKAFAAFLEAAGRAPDSKLVFWHTYDARIPEGLPAPDPDRAPPALRQFL